MNGHPGAEASHTEEANVLQGGGQNTILVRPYGFLDALTIRFDPPIANMDAAHPLCFDLRLVNRSDEIEIAEVIASSRPIEVD